MANIRIKDQTTDTALAAGDYVIVDNETEGTRKFDLGQKLEWIDSDITDLEDRVEVLEEGGGGSGLTDDIKLALDQLAQKVAYIDEDGQDYYDALHNALYPPANLTRISCVYTQSGSVYATDTLDSLKSDLVVTAHFSNGTTQTVTTYTLSGTLTVGTSTITVSYGGKTTTFNVVVSQYDWIDMRGSMTTWAQNKTNATITVTEDSAYIKNNSAGVGWGINMLQNPLSLTTYDLLNGVARITADVEISGYDSSQGRGLLLGFSSFNKNNPTSGNDRTKASNIDITESGHYEFVMDIDSDHVNIATNEYFGVYIYLNANNGTEATLTNVTVEYKYRTPVSLSVVQNDSIFNTDNLESIKNVITVTATDDDGHIGPITNYTLSGSLALGTSAITVTCGNVSTTFNATVTQSPYPFAVGVHDFTNPAGTVEAISGNTAEITSSVSNANDTHANMSNVSTNTSACNSTNNYANNGVVWFTIPANAVVNSVFTINYIEDWETNTGASSCLRDISKTNVFGMMTSDFRQTNYYPGVTFKNEKTFESATDIACVGMWMGTRSRNHATKINASYMIWINGTRYI